MKQLTVTLQVTDGVPRPQLPSGAPMPEQAGFRATLTAESGNAVSQPISFQTVWKFGGMPEGAKFKLTLEGVDGQGNVLQSLPVIDIVVPLNLGGPVDPGAGTYTRLDGYALSWAEDTP